jgi:cap2 methyltransferase
MHLFKPATSREGNSEIYVVCLNYMGMNSELLSHLLNNVENSMAHVGNRGLFKAHFLPKGFLTNLVECANYFVETQVIFNSYAILSHNKILTDFNFVAISFRFTQFGKISNPIKTKVSTTR